MKVLLLTIILLPCVAQGVDLKYPVSEIPEELKSGVNVVLRDHSIVYRISAIDKAVLNVHYVVTVLNEKGNEFATHVVDYNKLSRVSDFEAAVYDGSGIQIKRLKNSEIRDQSYMDGAIYSDARLRYANLAQPTYPYTVEFNYEKIFNYVYNIPGITLGSDKYSIEHISYQLIFAPGLEPRYKVLNMADAIPGKQTAKDGFQSLLWSFTNLKALQFEAYGERLIPRILAAPREFNYDGHPGNMSTWKDYGKWQYQLNAGRNDLSEATKAKVKQLVSGLKTDEEKAKVLYEYMQSKTRYVSIQDGIGGLQPFSASEVEEKGYGDCKALSNYMVSLLQTAGVKAYYCKISGGYNEPELILDFPSHQTNHIIVAMPLQQDTVWMECTSQTAPFGYLGSFTGDRWAIMVTADGGTPVRTPRYSPDQNSQMRTVNVTVDASGNAKADAKTTYRATQFDPLEGFLESGPEDQRKWIQSNTDIPSFTLNGYSVKSQKSKIPSTQLSLSLTLSRYASVSGKRFFVAPNVMNRISASLSKMENRQSDVVVRSNYLDVDTVNLHLPEALYPEFLPQPVKIKSRFGEYEATCEFKDGVLVYVRRMKVWKGKYPKESYNELVDFYKGISKADNSKIVFLNKT